MSAGELSVCNKAASWCLYVLAGVFLAGDTSQSWFLSEVKTPNQSFGIVQPKLRQRFKFLVDPSAGFGSLPMLRPQVSPRLHLEPGLSPNARLRPVLLPGVSTRIYQRPRSSSHPQPARLRNPRSSSRGNQRALQARVPHPYGLPQARNPPWGR